MTPLTASQFYTIRHPSQLQLYTGRHTDKNIALKTTVIEKAFVQEIIVFSFIHAQMEVIYLCNTHSSHQFNTCHCYIIKGNKGKLVPGFVRTWMNFHCRCVHVATTLIEPCSGMLWSCAAPLIECNSESGCSPFKPSLEAPHVRYHCKISIVFVAY